MAHRYLCAGALATAVAFSDAALAQRSTLPAAASPTSVQRPLYRGGFWFSLGIGGSTLGCQGCDGREFAPGVHIAAGGPLNPHWLVGGLFDQWIRRKKESVSTARIFVAGVRWYPSEVDGFFVIGGPGYGFVNGEIGNSQGSRSGPGATFGLGYDFSVTADDDAVTPFLHVAAFKYSRGIANFVTLGIAATTRCWPLRLWCGG